MGERIDIVVPARQDSADTKKRSSGSRHAWRDPLTDTTPRGDQLAMLARVTMWEGGTPDSIRAASEEMRSNVSKGPPPGLKSVGLTMLVDPEGARVLMIGMFASEDDLRESEPVLEQMSPPEGIGNRTATDVYEVATDVRM